MGYKTQKSRIKPERRRSGEGCHSKVMIPDILGSIHYGRQELQTDNYARIRDLTVMVFGVIFPSRLLVNVHKLQPGNTLETLNKSAVDDTCHSLQWGRSRERTNIDNKAAEEQGAPKTYHG